MSIVEKMKGHWAILSMASMIAVVSWGAAMGWSDLEQRVTEAEKANTLVAGMADKLFDFTMNLWNIDPDSRKKWKVIPMVKPDSVVCGYEWTEFEGLDRWLHYKYRCDSVGVPALLVDTLHVQKQKTEN